MLDKIQALAWWLVQEYAVEPKTVHAALLKIDVYRKFWTS